MTFGETPPRRRSAPTPDHDEVARRDRRPDDERPSRARRSTTAPRSRRAGRDAEAPAASCCSPTATRRRAAPSRSTTPSTPPLAAGTAIDAVYIGADAAAPSELRPLVASPGGQGRRHRHRRTVRAVRTDAGTGHHQRGAASPRRARPAGRDSAQVVVTATAGGEPVTTSATSASLDGRRPSRRRTSAPHGRSTSEARPLVRHVAPARASRRPVPRPAAHPRPRLRPPRRSDGSTGGSAAGCRCTRSPAGRRAARGRPRPRSATARSPARRWSSPAGSSTARLRSRAGPAARGRRRAAASGGVDAHPRRHRGRAAPSCCCSSPAAPCSRPCSGWSLGLVVPWVYLLRQGVAPDLGLPRPAARHAAAARRQPLGRLLAAPGDRHRRARGPAADHRRVQPRAGRGPPRRPDRGRAGRRRRRG